MKNLSILFMLMAIVGAASDAASGETLETREDIAREIRSTVVQLDALRLKTSRRSQEHADAVSLLDQQLERLREDLERTTAELAAERKQIAALEVRAQAAEQTHAICRAALADAAARSSGVVARLRERVAGGVPFHKTERVAQLDHVTAGLRASSTEQQTEALNLLWTFLGEEIHLAQTLGWWNKLIPLDAGARAVHAYRVRLGIASEFFASEEGSVVGLAHPDSPHIWDIAPDEAVKHQILKSLAILQTRDAPGIQPAPFVVGASSATKIFPSEPDVLPSKESE